MFRFDETDPRFLIIYTGDEHATPQDYRNMVDYWIAHLEHNQPFGVIIVHEPHEHREDEASHREHEAEITRITNDFRRDYRDRTSQINTGYARVFPPDMVKQYWRTPEEWEESREANNRYAQYSWGIPGNIFTDLASAQQWLAANNHRQPSIALDAEQPLSVDFTGRVGLFYGSSTGITQYIAEEVQETWVNASTEPIKSVNITDVNDITQLLAFDYLILGISTWNIGQLQDDWEMVFPQFDTLDFSGIKVAIFGVGDQEGYPDNFLDAVGILGAKLTERGAELVGYWYDEHYKFRESTAFIAGKFMGLGIDDRNQARLTSSRIENWVAQIITEFALQPQAVSSAR